MKRALFVILPTRSHVNGVLGLARFFRENEYEVHFTSGSSKALDLYIRKQGFFNVPTGTIPCALPLKVEWSFYKLQDTSLKTYIVDKLRGKIFSDRCFFLQKTIDSIKPSVILIDSFIGADFLCIYNISKSKEIRIQFVNTMGIFFRSGLPPPTSVLFPHQVWQIRSLEIKRRMLHYIGDVLETLVLLGRGSGRLISRKIRELGISREDCMLDNRPMGITFRKYTELVLSGRDFEFPVNTEISSTRKFIGMLLDVERAEMVDADYHRLLNLLQNKNDIVYISFGSLAGRQKRKVERFLNILPEVSSRLPGVVFVISGIKGALRENLGSCPNIQVFGSVPQQRVLSRSRAFITHGGFNSIKESIYFSVPMIVYPINMKYDQNGNAARVSFHKIGLYGSIQHETGAGLLDKLNTLFYNRSYKSNIISLRKKLSSECSPGCLRQILFH